MKAILIQNEGGPVVIDLPDDNESDGGTTLAELQRIVGGRIEALRFPGREDTTIYIEDESLYNKSLNPMATAIMAPIIAPLTAIHGPMLICGFNAAEGRTTAVPDVLIETYVTAPEAGGMNGADGLASARRSDPEILDEIAKVLRSVDSWTDPECGDLIAEKVKESGREPDREKEGA